MNHGTVLQLVPERAKYELIINTMLIQLSKCYVNYVLKVIKLITK